MKLLNVIMEAKRTIRIRQIKNQKKRKQRQKITTISFGCSHWTVIHTFTLCILCSYFPLFQIFCFLFQVETTNPVATIWMVNLTRPTLLFPFELKRTANVDLDSYITSVSFHGQNNVGIVWLNRPQNAYVIATCTPGNNYSCSEVSFNELKKSNLSFEKEYSINILVFVED